MWLICSSPTGTLLIVDTGRGARVQPGKLVERGPFVVDEVLWLMLLAGFDQDDFRALLAELVGERAAR